MIDKNPKFSIITPCFNSEKTIEKTLDSVLYQTEKDYEYIIIDGGSDDNTLGIIDKYKAKFGDRLRVVSEKDNGIYDAMNKGIGLANGVLIGIVNSDDYYEHNCLEIVNTAYNEQAYDDVILYGGMRSFDSGSLRQEAFYHADFLNEQMINHPASFVAKSVYDKYGKYDLMYKSAADYDFMLKMKSISDIKFVPIKNVLTNFAFGGMSGTITNDYETLAIRYKYGIVSRKNYIVNRIKLFIKEILL